MAPILYGATDTGSPDSLYQADPGDGSLTTVGPIGFCIQAMAEDPTDGTLYGIIADDDPSNPNYLCTIDKTTGAGTLVGDTTDGALVDMSFDSAGNLYAVQDFIRRLYSIDKVTGTATLLGAMSGSSPNAATLSADSSDVFYAQFSYLDGGDLRTVNIATHTATHVVNTSNSVSSDLFPASASFSPVDILFMAAQDQDTNFGYLGTLDTGTGVFTSIAHTSVYLKAIAWGTGTTPPPPGPPAEGISGAFGDAAYSTTPTFVRMDDPTVPPLTFDDSGNNVTAFTIDRGRSYELDKTQTGTAQFTLLDSSGTFDPTNRLSPLYGMIGPMVQTKINVLNQAVGTYHDLFTGFLESYEFTMTQDAKLMTIQVGLVDGFEPLSRCEIPVEANGTTVFLATSDVQTRIDALLDVAGWPTAAGWRNINTGNVFLQRTVYNPQTAVLAAIQDAADADFPGVANVFMRKDGRIAFLGRYPRFKPLLFPQDVQFWTCSDAPAVGAFPGALIKNIEWNLDQKNLINAALCYPFGIAQTDIMGQLVFDSASIAKYGYRSKSLPDLIEDGQPSSTFQPALDPNPVALAYAQYYVENYKNPQLRISKLEIEATLTSSADTWNFILGVEIGDIISVYTSNPGGGGFGKGTGDPLTMTPAQFFVEGVHYVGSLENGAQVITLNLDVSPREWFNFEPWAS